MPRQCGIHVGRGWSSWVATRVVVACALVGCIPQESVHAPGNCPLSECSDWTYRRYVYDGFSVVGFRKPGHQANRLAVYIEGDGNAWRRRSEISDDPTPQDPIGLRLALRDPATSVLYLARPCQFLDKKSLDGCDSSLWTSARFSPDVIAAMDRAISVEKASPEERLALVGYSGGGVIAVLVASRRPDVEELITVAAPLDVVAWTKHHRVSPLEDSLDPLENAPASEMARVAHFHGGRDKTVPPIAIARYRVQASGEKVRFITVPAFDHRCCWVRDWTKLLAMIREQRRIP